MGWWRRLPTHGERGLKLLEGRAAVAYVGCCVLWLCLVLCSHTFYPFCRVEHPTHGDILPHFNPRTNAKLLSPSQADTPPCTVNVAVAVKMGGCS